MDMTERIKSMLVANRNIGVTFDSVKDIADSAPIDSFREEFFLLEKLRFLEDIRSDQVIEFFSEVFSGGIPCVICIVIH